jgi:hypothetical protein
MASATYGNARAKRVTIAAGRRRPELRPLDGGRAAGLPGPDRGRAQRAGWGPPRRGILRGAAASLLIAAGYVAAVTAMRALLALP